MTSEPSQKDSSTPAHDPMRTPDTAEVQALADFDRAAHRLSDHGYWVVVVTPDDVMQSAPSLSRPKAREWMLDGIAYTLSDIQTHAWDQLSSWLSADGLLSDEDFDDEDLDTDPDARPDEDSR